MPALEQVLDVLAHAGFDDDTAVRALQFVLGVVWGNTHDQLLAGPKPDGIHPQQTQMLSPGSRPRRVPTHEAGSGVATISMAHSTLASSSSSKA